MFCKHCGFKLDEDSKFCGSCGNAVKLINAEIKTIKNNFPITLSQEEKPKEIKKIFCQNCDAEMPENLEVCSKCGRDIKTGKSIHNTSKTDIETKDIIEEKQSNTNKDIKTGEPMSIEEYMSYTNIKSVDEAQKYYSNLKMLFILVFIGLIVVKGMTGIDSGLYAIIWLADIALLIYFVVYCVKVVNAEKISKASAAFSILFAPISWFWFYPNIMEPLKIIIGKKTPPQSLTIKKEKTEKEKTEREISNKKYWNKYWILMGVIFGIILLLIILVGISNK